MINFKFIKTSDPDYPRERALRWETIHKPLGLPPGAEICPEDEKGMHLIALEKKEVIGCILVSQVSEKTSKIVQLALSDVHNHQGFCRKLLHFLENHLFEKGVTELQCSVKKDLINFYERLGFHQDKAPHDQLSSDESVLLHKQLHAEH